MPALNNFPFLFFRYGLHAATMIRLAGKGSPINRWSITIYLIYPNSSHVLNSSKNSHTRLKSPQPSAVFFTLLIFSINSSSWIPACRFITSKTFFRTYWTKKVISLVLPTPDSPINMHGMPEEARCQIRHILMKLSSVNLYSWKFG